MEQDIIPGVIAGKILSDIINSKDNKYIDLFNPNRHMNLEKFKNRTINIFSNVKAYIDTKLTPNKSWYKGSVKFEIRNGKKVGIYIDQKGIEHIVYNICPHLRCGLIFNMQDKTWDCPCHSSRFNIDGKIIKGPSLHDITFNENE